MTHTPSPTPRVALVVAAVILGAQSLAMAWSTSAGAHQRVPAADAGADVAAAATAALDWIEGELADNGGTLPGPGTGTTDWGLTSDAALALLAHGRGADATTSALVDVLLDSLDGYTTWDSLGAQYSGVRLLGPLAKALLVAESAERSTTVDGLDLPAELLSLMVDTGASKGRFADRNPHGADSSNVIGQSLAILALSHQQGGPPAAAVTFLSSRQCPGGGFPLQIAAACTDDANADPDASALALDALLCAGRTDAVESALSRLVGWLLGRADTATGAFGGLGPTAGLNANSTGLVGHAMGAAGQGDAAAKAAAWVIESLQLDSDLVSETPAAAESGAVAYNPEARAAALANGIDPLLRDQWRRAGAQAVLVLGAEPFGVPAEGEPVVASTTTTSSTSTTSTTAVPSTASTASTVSTVASSSAPPAAVAGATAAATDSGTSGEELAATGSRTFPMVAGGLALVAAGASSLLVGRRTGRRRQVVGASVLLVGIAAAAGWDAPVADAQPLLADARSAGSDGPCPTADGVTVVVDFASLGEGVHVRCAAGSPSTGFGALELAGIDYDTALRSSGFLCRIAGKPSTDPCIDPSPAAAHWSYWLADRGGSWCYSNLGAGVRRPPKGTVEGWVFEQGSSAAGSRPPAIAPPAAVQGAGALAGNDCNRSAGAPSAPPATASPTTAAPPGVTAAPSASAAPGGAAPGATAAPGPVSQAPSPSTPSTVGGAVSTTPSEPPTGVSTTVAAEVAGATTIPGSDPAASGDGSSDANPANGASTVDLSESGDEEGGSPVGTLVAGVAGAVLLGGAIALRARRGRSDAAGPDAAGPDATEAELREPVATAPAPSVSGATDATDATDRTPSAR
jgi:hypothetical protein